MGEDFVLHTPVVHIFELAALRSGFNPEDFGTTYARPVGTTALMNKLRITVLIGYDLL